MFYILCLFIVSWNLSLEVIFKKVYFISYVLVVSVSLGENYNTVLLLPARAFFDSYREDHEMMHLRDLQKLEGVLSPSHLKVHHYSSTYTDVLLHA